MKKFLIKLSAFVGICSLIILIWCMWQTNSVLTLTNSNSLDVRFHEMRKMTEKHFDIIAVGSSMTLYQLDGKTFTDSLPEKRSFYNFSAWGMSMADDYEMLTYLIPKYTPKQLIIFSNIIDFENDYGSAIKIQELKNYLDSNPFNDILLTINYGFPNNIETNESYQDRHFNPTDPNEDLRYDEYGGVLLDVYGDDIIKVRYDEIYDSTPKEVQYDKLTEIAEFCKENKVELIFAQTPFRSHFVSEEEESYQVFEDYYDRCKEIVEKDGGYYTNFVDFDKYTDKYFADSIHLNIEGALMLTQDFCEWYDDFQFMR